jgi:outer membrane protein
MGLPRFQRARWRIAVCLLLASILPAAHAADLLEIYYQSLDNDPTYTAASFELEAMKEKVPEARSALWPSGAVTGSDGITAGTTAYTATPQVNRSYQSYQWMLQLTQPIFHIDNWLALDQAHLAMDQAMSDFMRAKQDLILRVTQAYFDVLVARETVSVADAQMQALDEQLAAAQRSYDKGVASVTDADEARARAALARSQREAGVADLDNKTAALELIIGSTPDTLSPLRDGVIAPRPDPDDVDSWVQRAGNNNYAVFSARAAVQIAMLQVNRAHDQRYPNIDLVASYGHNYSTGNITDPNDYGTRAGDGQIGVQLSVPIFDGGAMHAQVLEAKARAGKAAAQLDLARRQAIADARNAYSGISSDMIQIEALESAVKSGANSLKGNVIGYGLGIRINIDVLNAEQQWFQSRRDLAKARYDVLMQALKLKEAAGTLGVPDVETLNAMLVKEEPAR